MASTLFKAWASRLRIPFLVGAKGGPITQAFASVIGDSTIDWMTQALVEHLPEYASSYQSVTLTASERQLDTYAGEPQAQLATRLTFATQLWRFAGTPLGVLLGLHFAGFDGAVIVTQNGIAYQLTLPLPAMVSGQVWDPTPNLSQSATSQLLVPLTSSLTPSRSIPTGTNWFAFDSNTDMCSRFAVIFPSANSLSFMFSQVALANFSSADSASILWDQSISASSYTTIVGPPVVTDGSGPVVIVADGTTKTTTGVTIRASAAFNGYAYVSAYPALSATDTARLKTSIARWKPAKATCVGVYVIQTGDTWDWPTGTTWDGDSNAWDVSSSLQLLGAF